MYQTGWMKFKVISDSRGNLSAIEGGKDIPFSIKRVYYITGVESGVERGFHAHRQLHQVLLCLHGSLKVRLFNGTQKEEVVLNDPAKGLYVGPWVWREMYDFSPGAVLLVLASAEYDEADYIRSYEAYLSEAKAIFDE